MDQIGPMSTHWLAQVNVARAVAPLDDPRMREFVAALPEINGLADRSPGFVWRLEDDSGAAIETQAYEDPRVLFNMSVWQSLEALKNYVYRSQHGDFMRRRRLWFEPAQGPSLALFWVPRDQLPTARDGVERLEHLRQHGPTAFAVDFRQHFEPASGVP